MKYIILVAALVAISGCIPMMVVGAGNYVKTRVDMRKIEKRIIKLEERMDIIYGDVYAPIRLPK